jgi:Ni/Co efflux regulator RcnB
MKRAAVIAALVASLMAGSAAMAGPHGRDGFDHREPPRAAHRDDRHDSRRDDHDRNFRPAPPPRVVYRAPVRYGVYHRPVGYYDHAWRRGERLPVAYYQRPYVIADYRGCGLREPPRGYHWVRVNGDAVLAAVATGIVLDTVIHLF